LLKSLQVVYAKKSDIAAIVVCREYQEVQEAIADKIILDD
jgi:hypothetical protein